MIDCCIICGTNDNLNTELTITVDDDRVVVRLCDEHAESTTPKMAKDKYLIKKAEIDEFIKKAEEMGLQVSLPSSNKKLAAAKKISPQAPSQTNDQGMISASEAAKYYEGRTIEIDGGESATINESQRSQEDGQVRISKVPGPLDSQVDIPTYKRDKMGTTSIRVIKGFSDKDLQNRFKTMAGMTMSEESNMCDGYTTRDCMMCSGSGIINIGRGNTKQCPKCNGTGTIDIIAP